MTDAGRLTVVGTPIGNLGDLSPRARAALAEADAIACEDTRHTRKLLSAAAITGARLLAVHQHNEAEAAAGIVNLLAQGQHVALVTDAGMPGISDPGTVIVAAAIDAGMAIDVVPGPTAVAAALAVSGLDVARFCFEGFLPRKGRERADRLDAIASEPRAVVLFEAPGRVAKTLADLEAACGPERRVAVCRELTKLHEEVVRGPLCEVVARRVTDKGEVVIVLDGDPAMERGPVVGGRGLIAKVVAYVTRPGGELLVFDHDGSPNVPVQVPRGTLHPAEAPAEGVLRELAEESGLTDVRIVRPLGSMWRYAQGRELVDHSFHIEPLTPTPDTWEWDECGDGDVPLHRFRFRWASIDAAQGELHEGFTAVLPALRQSLRR